MHMAIALLTTKGKNGEPFCWNDLPDRFSHLINESLKLQVFFQGKVPGGLFAVLAWSDQRVAVERGVFGQKHNGALILRDHMMRIGASHQCAEKTGAFFHALFVGADIKGMFLTHALSPEWVMNGLITWLHGIHLSNFLQEGERRERRWVSRLPSRVRSTHWSGQARGLQLRGCRTA